MNAVLGSAATASVDSHNLTWQEDSEAFAIPVGTQEIEYTMNFIRSVGTDNDSFIDDNSLVVSIPSTSTAAPEPSYTVLSALAGVCGSIALRGRPSRR